jgi:hypothetical protein
MKSLTAMAFLMAIALIAHSSTIRNASAEVEPVLLVEGPSTVDPSVSQTFNVSIIIENVPSPGFYGWEFYLSWTPGVINCTSETLNLGIWTPHGGPWVPSPIDNTLGQYHQSLTGQAPATEKTGTWWLVNLTFWILASPPVNTNLTLSPPAGCTYCIADMDGEEISHEYQDLSAYIVPEFLEAALLPILMLLSSTAIVLAKKLEK